MTDAFTDRERLQTQAYASSNNLQARRNIYAYRDPPADAVEFAMNAVEWRGDEVLLDVGCGPGQYVTGIRARYPHVLAFLADLSPGMVREAKTNAGAPGLVADVSRLPFEDDRFDVTLAMHMLYHVPDIDAAVGELRRVTKLGGLAIVSTNGLDHMKEFREIMVEALNAVRGTEIRMPLHHPSERFAMETGAEVLGRVFADVRPRWTSGIVRLPEAQPFVDYVESVRSLLGPLGGNDEEWSALVSYCDRRVSAAIGERGIFDLTVSAGLFVCR